MGELNKKGLIINDGIIMDNQEEEVGKYKRQLQRMEKETRAAYAEIENMKKQKHSHISSEKRNEYEITIRNMEVEMERMQLENDQREMELREIEEKLFNSKLVWAEENNFLRSELERAEQTAVGAQVEYAQIATMKENLELKLKQTKGGKEKKEPKQKKKWKLFKKKNKKDENQDEEAIV